MNTANGSRAVTESKLLSAIEGSTTLVTNEVALIQLDNAPLDGAILQAQTDRGGNWLSAQVVNNVGVPYVKEH